MNKEMRTVLLQILRILMREKQITEEEGEKAMAFLGEKP